MRPLKCLQFELARCLCRPFGLNQSTFICPSMTINGIWDNWLCNMVIVFTLQLGYWIVSSVTRECPDMVAMLESQRCENVQGCCFFRRWDKWTPPQYLPICLQLCRMPIKTLWISFQCFLWVESCIYHWNSWCDHNQNMHAYLEGHTYSAILLLSQFLPRKNGYFKPLTFVQFPHLMLIGMLVLRIWK